MHLSSAIPCRGVGGGDTGKEGDLKLPLESANPPSDPPRMLGRGRRKIKVKCSNKNYFMVEKKYLSNIFVFYTRTRQNIHDSVPFEPLTWQLRCSYKYVRYTWSLGVGCLPIISDNYVLLQTFLQSGLMVLILWLVILQVVSDNQIISEFDKSELE